MWREFPLLMKEGTDGRLEGKPSGQPPLRLPFYKGEKQADHISRASKLTGIMIFLASLPPLHYSFHHGVTESTEKTRYFSVCSVTSWYKKYSKWREIVL
jgi:hypothetical protein